jgi:hypothetical protein
VEETDETYRQAVSRQHRIYAHYLALYAWRRKLDCLIINRQQLLKLLNLKAIKQTRMAWFEEDFRPWFPELHTMWASNNMDRLSSVFLSRLPVPRSALQGSMTTEMRIVCLVEEGIPAGTFLGGRYRGALPNEKDVVSVMSLLAGGLETADKIPGFAVLNE